MNKLVSTAVFPVLLVSMAWSPKSTFAGERAVLNRQDFVDLHALIKRQARESRWMEIDWHPSVWEARQRAAKEGKPIFLMAGSGGAPAAGC